MVIAWTANAVMIAIVVALPPSDRRVEVRERRLRGRTELRLRSAEAAIAASMSAWSVGLLREPRLPGMIARSATAALIFA